MVQTKKMDESAFAKIIKEFNAVGEMIRARQDEKQSVIDEFGSESKRFFFGKISQKTLASSVRKTNKEFRRLDNDIRKAMVRANDLANQEKRFVSAQSPKVFTATLSGISLAGSKKKKKRKARKKPVRKAVKRSVKKKVVKRRVVKKKPVKKKAAKKK